MKKMCAIMWCYTGATRAGRTRRFKPIRAVPHAADGLRRAHSLAGAAESLRRALPDGACSGIGRPTSSQELSDKAIDLHVKYGEQLPTMHSTMHLYPINGAAHSVGRRSDTAFSFREANFAEVIVGVDPDPANNARMMQWAKRLLDWRCIRFRRAAATST